MVAGSDERLGPPVVVHKGGALRDCDRLRGCSRVVQLQPDDAIVLFCTGDALHAGISCRQQSFFVVAPPGCRVVLGAESREQREAWLTALASIGGGDDVDGWAVTTV